MLKRYNLNYESYMNNLHDNELIKKIREQDITRMRTYMEQVFNFIVDDIENNHEFIEGFIISIRNRFTPNETINSVIEQLRTMLIALINELQKKGRYDLISTGNNLLNQILELYRKQISQ